MKISLKWLSDFVSIDLSKHSTEMLSETLTNLGLEVEDVVNQAQELNRFVVGIVIECVKHPKADKLSVCTVEVGEEVPRTIVCGASNVAAGQYVCVALDGAIIPGAGFEIGKRTLRGVESNGMICSREELGADPVEDGIWVLAQSPGADQTVVQAVGKPLADFLNHNDVILDVFITPNRSDCNSHRGVAREILAYMELNHPDGQGWARGSKPLVSDQNIDYPNSSVSVRIEPDAQALCPHYEIAVIDGVTIGPSPEWLQDRLKSVGQRPRNVVVDVTNYINLELGQPLHAFDAGCLSGGVVLKTATTGQKFTTLDGKERELPVNALLICDEAKPIAIAGVMGGRNSEITGSTTRIVLESAYFQPASIRATARIMALQTDASYRFERGVDPGNIRGALHQAVTMICELTGGTCSGVTTEVVQVFVPKPVTVRYERMRNMIGADISNERQKEMFEALLCTVMSEDSSTEKSGTSITVLPPSWRVDLNQEIDFSEEVMRLHGINNVPAAEYATTNLNTERLPFAVKAGGEYGTLLGRAMLNRLMARGYVECYTGTLTGPEASIAGLGENTKPVTLKNALGHEYSAMRGTAIPQLLRVAAFNQHRGEKNGRYMEIAKTYKYDNENAIGVSESQALTLLVAGEQEHHLGAGNAELDLYDVFGDVLSVLPDAEFRPMAQTTEPPNSLMINAVEVWHRKKNIGKIAQVLPSYVKKCDVAGFVFVAELYLRIIEPGNVQYSAVSAYPSVQRDLALIVDETVTAGSLVDTLKKACTLGVPTVEVFDVYRNSDQLGADKKSVGLSLTFSSKERTLVDEEVDKAMREIINAAAGVFGAHVRGAE